MIESISQKPFLNIMFGNFYCPGFDDQNFIKETMRFIKELGFNCVMLDTKDSQDYRDRIEKKTEPSQYVMMQEYMEKAASCENLSYNFLLLYLNGDNLYPHIRFSPPVIPESVKYIDGTDARYYKYWSEPVLDAMTEHVRQIMTHYDNGICTCDINGKRVKPTCTMWDPIVAVSFDDEGIVRYQYFLKKEYQNIFPKKAELPGYWPGTLREGHPG
mgnify:FL=1